MDIDIDADKSGSQIQASKISKTKSSRGHEITTKTIKTPPFSYACLELISSSPPPSASQNTPGLDAVTTRTYITSALTQFLGLTGSSISIDILKIEGSKAWIRTPREDLAPVIAATGGWVGKGMGPDERVGWRVRGSGNWLSTLVAKSEEDNIWKD